jgi:hypothetical protein
MVEENLKASSERQLRFNGVRYLCHLNALVWLAPALIYQFFPFDFPVLVNWYVVLPIIFVTIAVPYASALLANRLMFAVPPTSESPASMKLAVCVAFLSPLLLFADLFVFRGLALLGDIEVNRSIYMETGPSLVGYFALFGLAASLYLLTKSDKDFSFWFLLPWMANTALFILSGNRQYALFGVIILFYARFITRRVKITALSIVYFFSGILAFATLALAVQFLRQLSKEGRQTEFLYTISGIQCHSWFCENPLETPLLYIYGYFGNIYSGLTIAASDIASAPVFSLTLPVFYRRFSPLIDGPSQDFVMANISDSIEARHDIFPNFWATMHAAIFYETGVFGIMALMVLVFMLLTFAFSGWIRYGESRFQSSACVGMAFLAVGVMYFPLGEPVNFVLFVAMFLLPLFTVHRWRA